MDSWIFCRTFLLFPAISSEGSDWAFDANRILSGIQTQVHFFRVNRGFWSGCSNKIKVSCWLEGFHSKILLVFLHRGSLKLWDLMSEWRVLIGLNQSSWSLPLVDRMLVLFEFCDKTVGYWWRGSTAWESWWVNGRLKVIEGVMQAHPHFLTGGEKI